MLRRATSAFAGDEVSAEESCAGAGWRRRPCNALWDDESCARDHARQIQLAREAGRARRLPIDLNASAGPAVAVG